MSDSSCEAYQRGDSMYCDKCGYTWDTNDPDPPECKAVVSVHDTEMIKIQETLKLDN